MQAIKSSFVRWSLMALISFFAAGGAVAQNASTWIRASVHPDKEYFCDTSCGTLVSISYNSYINNKGRIIPATVNFKYEIRYPSNIVDMVKREGVDAAAAYVLRGNSNYLQSIDYNLKAVHEFISWRTDVGGGPTGSVGTYTVNLNDHIRNKILQQITPIVNVAMRDTRHILIERGLWISTGGSGTGDTGGSGGGGGCGRPCDPVDFMGGGGSTAVVFP
jgi:uncharacterized membrane protein YgcG